MITWLKRLDFNKTAGTVMVLICVGAFIAAIVSGWSETSTKTPQEIRHIQHIM